MPRIRSLKPEFWQSEKMANCSPHARLLAIALLQMADSQGRMRWIPMQVHAHTFPFEEDVDVGALSCELEAIGYLVRYEAAGKKYAFIPGFVEHQRLTGKEAQTPSKHPPPPDVSRSTNETHPETQQGNTDCFPEKHLDAQEQGTGNREQGTVGTRARARTPPQDFTPNPIRHRQAKIQPGVDVEAELIRFKNHTFERPKDDWDGEWVKWITNAHPRRTANGARAGPGDRRAAMHQAIRELTDET